MTVATKQTAKNQQVTEVELVYRNKNKASERPPVNSSKAAYKLLLDTWDMGKIELQEQFRVLLVDRKSACIGISTIATGGIASCIVDLKLAFAAAIKSCASGMILAHNHPSGNRTPSEPDKRLTEQFNMAAKIFDVQILDHIIVTRDGYTSFCDEGLLTGGFQPEISVPF